MRNNYNIILGVLLVMAIAFFFITIGIIIGRKIEQNQQQISFPLEVGVDLGSASAFFLEKEFPNEYETIMAAATRNDCAQENILILFAIRKAENGPPGLEFGVMCRAGTDLDTQAGWAAATIVKSWKKWNRKGLWIGRPDTFIIFLGNRYCPIETSVLGNKNWIKNVTYWYEKLKGKER